MKLEKRKNIGILNDNESCQVCVHVTFRKIILDTIDRRVGSNKQNNKKLKIPE